MDNIRQLFVSYKFLDYDPEQLETPMSLPKPKPNRPISFNFKKGKSNVICGVCAIWYHLYNLKNVKNTDGGVLILVMLQAGACNFTKINTQPWVFFTFFKLYQMVPNRTTHHMFLTYFIAQCSIFITPKNFRKL